jgi:hypothetical protein
MSFWFVGDEECDDPRFCEAGMSARGFYYAAGAWCMRQVRGAHGDPIPAEWFVPDRWVRGWSNGARMANALVRVGLWERLDGGYCFKWIREQNKPETLRAMRAMEREKKSRTRAAAARRPSFRMIPGGS